MKNIQEILNEFSKSEVATARGDELVVIRNRRIVYEFNPKGEIINTYKSTEVLRDMGIRIDKSRGSIITRDGRIFSFNKTFLDFDSWYKKRKKKNSRSVLQFTTDGQFVKEWTCMSEMERKLGISRGNLKRYLKQGPLNKFGKLRTVGGFVWKDKF
jgi:hypothetical protein